MNTTPENMNSHFSSLLPFIIIPSLPEILFMTGISFSIAELFNSCGMFHDEDGIEATYRTTQFVQSHETVESALKELSYNVMDWISYNVKEEGGLFHLPTCKRRVEGLFNLNLEGDDLDDVYNNIRSRLALKHRFAIGSALGMVLHGCTLWIAKVATITYLLSEISENIISNHDMDLKQKQQQNESSFYHNNKDAIRDFFYENYDDDHRDHTEETLDFIFESCDTIKHLVFRYLRVCNSKLKWLRIKVRSILTSPIRSIEKILNGSWLVNEETLIAGFIFGIVLGSLYSDKW